MFHLLLREEKKKKRCERGGLCFPHELKFMMVCNTLTWTSTTKSMNSVCQVKTLRLHLSALHEEASDYE